MVRKIISTPKPKSLFQPSDQVIEISTDVKGFNHSAIAWDDGGILVVGGQEDRVLSRAYYLYRPESGHWQKHRAPFKGRITAGLCALGESTALLVGGTNRAESFDYDDEGRAGKGRQDAWIFEHGDWREVPSCANRHEAPTALACEGDAWVLDHYAEKWSNAEQDFSALPEDTTSHSLIAAFLRKRLIVYSSQEAFCWEPGDRSWRRIADPPFPSFGGALVETEDGLLLIGGREKEKDFSGRIDLFDGTEWRPFGTLRAPRAFHHAVRLGSRVIIIGGTGSDPGSLEVEVLERGQSETRSYDSVAIRDLTRFQAVPSREKICVIGGLSEDHAIHGVRWISI